VSSGDAASRSLVGRVVSSALLVGLGLATLAVLTAPRGGTVQLGAIAGPEVTVDRGPRALVALGYSPPSWFMPLVGVAALGVVGLAAVGYHRHGVDEAVILEVGEIGLTAIAAMALASWLSSAGASYPVLVLGSGAGGWLATQLLVRGIEWATEGPMTPADASSPVEVEEE
jgi:hypothetical protein